MDRHTFERLTSKFLVGDGCWEWLEAIAPDGYAHFWLDGKSRTAHRVTYELLVGQVPEGLVLDHLCRVRHCVNPKHLEPVTQRENVLRGVGNLPKSECPKGHPYSGDNLLIYNRPGSSPRRECRMCKSAAAKRSYQRMKEMNK